MSRDRELESAALRSTEQLVEWILAGAKGPDAELGVGTEHEKVGFADLNATPIAFDGERGICRLLDELASRFGWTRLYDGGHLMALERDGAAITLEPGGQLELSGAIFSTALETRDELEQHLREVDEVSRELGQVWFFGGVNAWSKIDDVPWVPKPRYDVMRAYLPRRGPLAAWMMKMTASIQANYDFRDEADAMEMLRLGAAASPLVTALFANSPMKEGGASGYASYRMQIWHETDPDRCGTPDFFMRRDATVADYVEWMLDVPMFFIKRDGRYLDMAGYSFRRFVDEGYQGHEATIGDWELHLSTAFPDVRMKRYIEVRSADMASPAHVVALAALWKGIYYDRGARDALDALNLASSADEVDALALICRREGLEGTWRGRSVRALATELVALAHAGLVRQSGGEAEAALLKCLVDDCGVARSPGERFAADWARHEGAPRPLIGPRSIPAAVR